MSAQQGNEPDRTGTARATVVVPCYNQSHFLAECLNSVRAQTLDAWEVVVVDDSSPDGDDIARVVRELDDARIRLVRHETNSGLGGARNTGIREARTEYVLPLDADDRIRPGCLEALVGALDADAAIDCAFADVQLFGRLDEVLAFPGPPPGKPMLRAEHTIPGAGTMMRKALWERLGGYDEADILRLGREDFEFWVRAFEQGCTFKRLLEPLYEYRILHSSMNVACRLRDDEIADYIYGKHRELFDRNGETKDFLCFWLSKAARASYLSDQRKRAFQLSMRAWRMQPSRARLEGSVRALLPFSVNESINAGEIRRMIPLVGYPLRGKQRHSPFFVIGMGRSGNTLLRRILTAHSQLHLPPETFVLGQCIKKFRKQGRRLNWPDLVSMIMAEFEFHPEFDLFEMNLVPLVQRLQHARPADRNLAYLFDAVFRHHAETHDVEFVRWGDKTPMNSLDDVLVRGDQPRNLGAGVPETLERLLDVFPDAQFLHIVRDGCDVVYSGLRGGFFGSIEDAAKRWLHVESQTRRFAERHAYCSHNLRYEDLVTDPEGTIRGVCTFLGVDFEPSMLASESAAPTLGDVPAFFWHAQVAKPINAKNPGKARRMFSRSEKERLDRLIGPALREFGYPPALSDE